MGELFNTYGTFWSLVPPVTAILMAFAIKEAYFSLFTGILIGSLFLSGFSPADTLNIAVNKGLISALADNAGIFLFLVFLGIIVALVNTSGGSAAFGLWAGKHVKTRIGAMLAAVVLGILVFVDDYFNCLTVGSVMLPITDRNKISRAKLSYLIDATAAPVCMIAPVSSWTAAVSGVAADLHTGISGIELFVRAIPYNFYSLLTIVFVIGLCSMNFDYGPMLSCELEVRRSGGVERAETESERRGHILNLLLPVLVLIVSCIVSMVYVGGFFGEDLSGSTEYAWNFLGAFGNTDAFIALPWGALVTLMFTVAFLVAGRVLSFREAMACIPEGFHAMEAPIIILTLATALKNITSLLGANVFVHDLMRKAAPGLNNMLPAVIFLVACLLAFASGTSWGTFGILMPIVAAIFDPDSTLLTIGISACLAGAVCGDHCSPISDTTVMASAGGQCDHLTHVSTQLPYAITVAAISFVTYIIAGIVQNAVLCLVAGSLLTVGVLFFIRAITGTPKQMLK